ncbi:MAG: hypothetical protein QGG36_27595 [Pirellulaceae bacterium]|nr:hypothetical protein [Pirellulaceae bacterium]MDP7019592.1 hypothetical protein [Pirellulaceae bacterium]
MKSVMVTIGIVGAFTHVSILGYNKYFNEARCIAALRDAGVIIMPRVTERLELSQEHLIVEIPGDRSIGLSTALSLLRRVEGVQHLIIRDWSDEEAIDLGGVASLSDLEFVVLCGGRLKKVDIEFKDMRFLSRFMLVDVKLDGMNWIEAVPPSVDLEFEAMKVDVTNVLRAATPRKKLAIRYCESRPRAPVTSPEMALMIHTVDLTGNEWVNDSFVEGMVGGSIVELYLGDTEITNQAFGSLESMRSLRILGLWGLQRDVQIDRTAIREFNLVRPDVTVSIWP